MYPHDRANISSQISPASGNSQVFDWIKTVCVDHEVPIILVDCWSLASISIIEEFRQGFGFDFVYLAHVEPGAITREDD